MATFRRRRTAARSSPSHLKMSVASSAPSRVKVSEHWHQSTFIAVIRKLAHPAGKITFAVPNGFLKSKSSRIRAWREGMVAGVLDVFNPTPMNGHHGHWIEFKLKGNVPSPEQLAFKEAMERNGYRVDVVYSWTEALEKWADYLDMEIRYDR
jgi:hypothetical protein